jgi:hypothetical protein
LSTNDTNVTKYAWDARNRLVRVADYGVEGGAVAKTVDYLYDVENRWIGERIDSDGDGVIDRTIGFAYDGNHVDVEAFAMVSIVATRRTAMWGDSETVD